MASKTKNKNKYASRLRTAEQCWLIANLDDVVEDNHFEDSGATYKHAFNTHHISLGPNFNSEQAIGKFFIGEEVGALFKIKEEELSALVPQIRLFRIDVDDKGKIKKDSIKEFHFPTHVEKNNVEAMIRGEKDRFGEAGINSVQWDLLGGTPAEASRYVTVSLELFFSSIQTLNQVPYSTGKKDDVTYFDLFRKKNDRAFKIRLDVGWSIPDENMYIFEGDRGKELIKALKRSNKSIYLALKDHQLEFNQNGTVTLKIDYQGSIEHDFKNISVIKNLDENTADAKYRKLKLKKLKEILAAYESSKCKVKATGWGAKYQITKVNEELYNDQVKMMKRQIKRFEANTRAAGMRTLRQINKNLEKPVSNSKGIPRSRVFSVSIDPEELGFTDGSYDPDINWTNRKTKLQDKAYLNFRSYISRQKDRAFPPIVPYFNPVDLRSTLTKNTAQRKEIVKIINGLYTQITAPVNGKDPTTIKYCFLGDIVDAVIESCIDLYKDSNPYLNSLLTNMKIVFGHVTLPTIGMTGDGFYKKINLNDLPISYNLFNAWYIRNVIDKGRTVFSLKDFIRRMITELVTAGLAANCFAKDDLFFRRAPKNRVEVSFFTLRIPRGSPEPFTGFDPSIPLSQIKSKKSNPERGIKKNSAEAHMFAKRLSGEVLKSRKFLESNSETSDAILTNYLFINAKSYGSNKRIKNKAKDLSEGIFHFQIGQSDGLVKEISFSKIESKEMEASLLTSNRKASASDLELIRRVYNATVTMYGNSSFIPGQLVYIDPHAVGFGYPDKNSIARAIGLGGYFRVVKVSHSISNGDFTTTIVCQWEAFGDGRQPAPAKIKDEKIKVKGKCNNAERARLVDLWNLNCDDEFKVQKWFDPRRD